MSGSGYLPHLAGYIDGQIACRAEEDVWRPRIKSQMGASGILPLLHQLLLVLYPETCQRALKALNVHNQNLVPKSGGLPALLHLFEHHLFVPRWGDRTWVQSRTFLRGCLKFGHLDLFDQAKDHVTDEEKVGMLAPFPYYNQSHTIPLLIKLYPLNKLRRKEWCGTCIRYRNWGLLRYIQREAGPVQISYHHFPEEIGLSGSIRFFWKAVLADPKVLEKIDLDMVIGSTIQKDHLRLYILAVAFRKGDEEDYLIDDLQDAISNEAIGIASHIVTASSSGRVVTDALTGNGILLMTIFEDGHEAMIGLVCRNLGEEARHG